MDNIRQQRDEENIRRQDEGRFSLEDLERDRGGTSHILHNVHTQEEISNKIEKQHKRKELHCATYTTSIQASSVPQTGPVLFIRGLHLPEGSDIGSLYLENHSGCNLNVFEGPGAVGRLIGYGTTNTYRVIAFADNISNCSIVIDLTKPLGDGLVICTLFSHHWAPKMGTIA